MASCFMGKLSAYLVNFQSVLMVNVKSINLSGCAISTERAEFSCSHSLNNSVLHVPRFIDHEFLTPAKQRKCDKNEFCPFSSTHPNITTQAEIVSSSSMSTKDITSVRQGADFAAGELSSLGQNSTQYIALGDYTNISFDWTSKQCSKRSVSLKQIKSH